MKKSLITILSVVLLLSLVGTVACQAIPDGVYNGGFSRSRPPPMAESGLPPPEPPQAAETSLMS